jgi:hypothetical protein
MQIKFNGVKTQVFLAEIVKAPAARRFDKLPSGSLTPVAAGIASAVSTKAGLAGFGVKTFTPQPKEKGSQTKILDVALTGCSIRFLMSDRALICGTDSFVPPNEVIAVDTKQNKLYLGSGTTIPARISVRRLHDDERIIVNQMQSAADEAEADRKRDAETVKLMAKIDTQGVNVNKLTGSIQTLTQMNAEEAAQREKWCEDPLSNREAIVDYLLSTRELKIQGDLAVSLLMHAYGKTQQEAATDAGVHLSTFKRALKKLRETPYKKIFDKTQKQKLETRQSIGSDKYAKMISLVKTLSQKEKEELRAFFLETINPAQRVNKFENEPEDSSEE